MDVWQHTYGFAVRLFRSPPPRAPEALCASLSLRCLGVLLGARVLPRRLDIPLSVRWAGFCCTLGRGRALLARCVTTAGRAISHDASAVS